MQASSVLQVVGGVLGMASGIAWYYAAFPVPPHSGVAYLMDRPPPQDTPFRRSWDRANRLNAIAACLTGAAAAIAGLGTALGAAGL